MIRVVRAALFAPLMVAGGLLTLTLGSANVLAASSHPESSSRAHDHDRLDCDPGRVSVHHHGTCKVVFTDKETKKEEHPKGQTVCFSVTPANAGSVTTDSGNCTTVGKNHKAFGTFTASGNVCGKVKIWATEPGENGQTRHTTIRITGCKETAATTTAALIPAGSPLPPSGGGWLLGVMGVSVALATGYAVRSRRWFAPGRLAADQSA